ncbi:hypothetical protein PROFUN_11314 [Planoprotostelium fungivorum]|uniref:Uncharacterized protein n=1 Tax=Planoprotostelium fungivorum TaxID=1890364 RepID=A0A2P6N2K1_9EUKA|nr:hypothetical protein PROFUN_11314 [Planoprotostelium fungivorum]
MGLWSVVAFVEKSPLCYKLRRSFQSTSKVDRKGQKLARFYEVACVSAIRKKKWAGAPHFLALRFLTQHTEEIWTDAFPLTSFTLTSP